LELMASAQRAEPWLRASWRSGELRLEAVSEALSRSDAWAELRAAAAADELWLVRDAPNAPRTYLTPVALEVGGTALVPALEPLREHLRARYGAAADAVVPSLGDWAGAHDGVSVCLPAQYAMPAATGAAPHAAIAVGDPVPGDAICAPLTAMVASLSTRGGGTGPRGEMCLRRRARMLGADGDYVGPLIGERCVTLPTRSESAMTLAVVGDEIAFNGAGANDLFVCIDNVCDPMPPDRTWMRLERAGLVEIRQGDRPSVARSQLGLTLLRLGVLDPRREWHPIGLYAASGPAADDRWSMLDHDEVNRFVYERSGQHLRFGVSISPELVAVYNAQTATHTQLTADVPLLVPTEGGFRTPRPAALVALATETSACPNAPAAAVRRSGLVDPQRMLVDQVFYVHLAHHRGEGLPYDCLATAGFRVTETMTQRVNASVRAGLLGDAQMMLFFNSPAALGVGLPLAYGRWRWVYGLGLDVSALLTTAVAFKDAGLTRAGGGLAASVYWGPEQYAPRLFSAGVMLHATAGTGERDEPLFSAFGALNLSTLFDLAGGR
jgi:hypothetical protein